MEQMKWLPMTLVFVLAMGSCRPAELSLEARLDERGRVAEVQVERQTWLTDLGLVLVKPQWQGNLGDQGSAEATRAVRSEEGGKTVFEGTFRAEGKTVRFREEVHKNPGALCLSYVLTAEQDMELESVILRGLLPLPGHAGTTEWVLCDGERTQRGTFPRELPDPYHLMGAKGVDWLAWVPSEGVGLEFRPQEGLEAVSLQDDRRFGMEAFEAQWRVAGTRQLTAGQTIRFGLILRPTTAERVRREEQLVRQESTMAAASLSCQEPLELRAVRPDRTELKVYERLELTLDLHATFDNPFDPDDIDVMATFASPQGEEVVVAGFYFQDYRRELWRGRERLRPVGQPSWKVRFTPLEAGPWQVTVRVRDRHGQVASAPLAFTVAPNPQHPGFIRRSPDSPWYLQFDNGASYFPVGENVCWAGDRGLFDYERWFQHLGAVGGNWARIWLVYWNMGLEWTDGIAGKTGRGRFYGLGRYSLDNAWRIDALLDLAERNGIFLMLCLGYHGELQDQHDFFGSEAWIASPYNAANGGPCATPANFWIDETARQLYRRKLRYLVARWGYSPQIVAWEFWNEVNAPAPWVQEMAQALRDTDVNRHLITTTYGNESIWELPEIDFTQSHHYGDSGNIPDSAEPLSALCQDHTARFGKPHLIGEFGIDWRTHDGKYDPDGQGVNLHHGLWAAALSRGMGGAMIWYWDGYVEPRNLYCHLAALNRFAASVPWARRPFEIARTTPPLALSVQETFTDLTIPCTLGWARSESQTFVVHPDGNITGGPIPQFLGHPQKAEIRNTPTFQVNYPQAGRLRIHVGMVSARAVLQVTVDGVVALEKEFLTGPAGEGPWKEATYFPEWQCHQCLYDSEIDLEVPAGQHVIRLENIAGDWLQITRLTFNGVRSSRYPDLRILGLQHKDLALLWLQNKDFNWYTHQQGREPRPIEGAQFDLLGLPDGEYEIEWWDTWQGQPIGCEAAISMAGKLPLQVPSLTRDIACQVQPKG